MSDPAQRQIVNELSKIVTKLDRINSNHVNFSRMVKTWLEAKPEEVTLEEMDREAFVIGSIVRVTDISHSLYKYVGEIEQINPANVRVRFMLGLQVESHVFFTAPQVEILPQPELHEGDLVRNIDPMSIVYKRIGKVTDPVYTATTVEVQFSEEPDCSGEIERRHLELVQTRGEAMGLAPLDVDDIVEVVEPRSMYAGRVGTVIGVRKDGGIRVIFGGEEGYALFTREELMKTGEQPYKEQ